ncbi:hypothetical protein [Actinomadura monticuli]|uniref:hypothetical protein n=1 Tax=Actinomadura monticuli TaxID=3097367 RepID=UPI00356424BC
MTQERVNLFADATGDHQWIHIDPPADGRELRREQGPLPRAGAGRLAGPRGRRAAVAGTRPRRRPRHRPRDDRARGRRQAGLRRRDRLRPRRLIDGRSIDGRSIDEGGALKLW